MLALRIRLECCGWAFWDWRSAISTVTPVVAWSFCCLDGRKSGTTRLASPRVYLVAAARCSGEPRFEEMNNNNSLSCGCSRLFWGREGLSQMQGYRLLAGKARDAAHAMWLGQCQHHENIATPASLPVVVG